MWGPDGEAALVSPTSLALLEHAALTQEASVQAGKAWAHPGTREVGIQAAFCVTLSAVPALLAHGRLTRREGACPEAWLQGTQAACQVVIQAFPEGIRAVVERTPSVSPPSQQEHLLARQRGHPQLMQMSSPAPRGMPRPAGIPRPGPAIKPAFSSAVAGGGPSTVTLTIVSPRRITSPSVRFCCTVGAASFSGAPFAFFPYASVSEARRYYCGGKTNLDCPELFALGEDKVHVLVVRQHLPNQRPPVVPADQHVDTGGWRRAYRVTFRR